MEDSKTAEQIVAECARKFGRIDVLVCDIIYIHLNILFYLINDIYESICDLNLHQINNAGAFSKPGIKDQEDLSNLDFLFNVDVRRLIGHRIMRKI
jgi:hypothetical protein